MILTNAKDRAAAALKNAEDILAGYGVKSTAELEVAENDLGEGESEALLVLGTIAISTEELTDEDIYYISFEAKVNDGEVDDAELEGAIAEFLDKVNAVANRLNMGPDATTVIKELDREVDERIEAEYMEAVEAAHKAVKRDMKVVIFAIVVLLIVAVACAVVSALPR